MIIPFIIFFGFSILMMMAAIKDASIMKIPNYISIYTVLLFFLILPFAWTGLSDLSEHLLVGVSIFILGFIMFALGWVGGGDAKLFAATSLWWTWPDMIVYVGYTGIIGGVIAIFIVLGRQYSPVWLSTSSWAYGLFKEEAKMPYGLALASGALLTLPQSAIWQAVIAP